jgi:opacity protein-like surface antigen
MSLIEKIVLGVAILAAASPALAVSVDQPVPAPVAGAGIGAILLIGAGYRALKSRIGR